MGLGRGHSRVSSSVGRVRPSPWMPDSLPSAVLASGKGKLKTWGWCCHHPSPPAPGLALPMCACVHPSDHSYLPGAGAGQALCCCSWLSPQCGLRCNQLLTLCLLSPQHLRLSTMNPWDWRRTCGKSGVALGTQGCPVLSPVYVPASQEIHPLVIPGSCRLGCSTSHGGVLWGMGRTADCSPRARADLGAGSGGRVFSKRCSKQNTQIHNRPLAARKAGSNRCLTLCKKSLPALRAP